jgi:5-methylcytosine-specific restriction protein A
LFEVHRVRRYTYVGEVELAGAPYAESQPDQVGQRRQVWVFPLRTKRGAAPLLPSAVLAEASNEKARRARRLTDAEIATKAEQTGTAVVGARAAVSQQYQRNPWVAEHAKRRAKGHCELCRKAAPFSSPDGKPYLEVHHIQWLAYGGADTIENTVALCPNCHRRMHVVRSDEDAQLLRAAAFSVRTSATTEAEVCGAC